MRSEVQEFGGVQTESGETAISTRWFEATRQNLPKDMAGIERMKQFLDNFEQAGR
jgi:hypothetical protein